MGCWEGGGGYEMLSIHLRYYLYPTVFGDFFSGTLFQIPDQRSLLVGKIFQYLQYLVLNY